MFGVIVAGAKVDGNLMDAVDVDNDKIFRTAHRIGTKGIDVVAKLYAQTEC